MLGIPNLIFFVLLKVKALWISDLFVSPSGYSPRSSSFLPTAFAKWLSPTESFRKTLWKTQWCFEFIFGVPNAVYVAVSDCYSLPGLASSTSRSGDEVVDEWTPELCTSPAESVVWPCAILSFMLSIDVLSVSSWNAKIIRCLQDVCILLNDLSILQAWNILKTYFLLFCTT